MLAKILFSLTGNRHHFRHMTFDELGELYASMMLRSLAMSMAGIFIPIYLYQQGYAIWEIFVFYSAVYATQFIFTVPIARLTARIGPKHTILISYFFQIATMVGLIYINDFPLIQLIAILFGISNIAFFTAFHVDFSKVKHSSHGGRELGWLYTMERIGAVLGPLIGGLLAFIFAPEYTFGVSIAILLFASVPLLLTKEPTKTHQKLNFSKLKLSGVRPDVASYSFFVVEIAVSMIVWPLFIGVVVFRDNPYIQIGSIVSLSILVAIGLARMIGKIVDNRRGRSLLRLSVLVNSLIHVVRPFTSGYVMALGINLVNEGVTAGYRMPYFKGMYDAADDHPGSRIVYIAVMELFANLSRAAFFIFAATCAYFVASEHLVFGILFFVGAISSLLIMLERFPALKPRKFLI